MIRTDGVKDVNRAKEANQICKCGKPAMVHSTIYPDEFTCEHLYFCNDCWWKYEGTPRKMADWQIAQKQREIEQWKEVMGYK